MVCFLYRWKLKPGHEESFAEAWAIVTAGLRQRGSLGARLHKGDDGLWYSYAQWPSADARTSAFAEPVNAEASQAMADAILERFPEVQFEVVDDRLAPHSG